MLVVKVRNQDRPLASGRGGAHLIGWSWGRFFSV